MRKVLTCRLWFSMVVNDRAEPSSESAAAGRVESAKLTDAVRFLSETKTFSV